MQSQKPYLCMTCGGKKHTPTHKKYYAAGIRKAKGGDYALTYLKMLGKNALGAIDGVLGVVGVNTDLSGVIKNNTSGLVSGNILGNKFNFEDASNKAINTAGAVGETMGKI